jgi:lipid A 3-O-deacylase
MKYYFKKTSLFILVLFVQTFYSQSRTADSLSTFEFKWSNDFVYNTDYYFTNGFAFEVFTNVANKNPINAILLPIETSDLELFGFTLTQNIFTPIARCDIHKQLNGDRPFAAYLLLGFKKVGFSQKNQIRTYSELQVGVLGPAALGKETQNGIHNNIPTTAPVIGWENQISNSLMINYSASIEKIVYTISGFDFSGVSSVVLGLPYTNLGVGFKTRIGFFNSLPKDFEFISSQKWQLFLTISASGSLSGYNATLQGGLFSESIYTFNNINRFVGHASLGITAVYKQFKMEYSQNFNTPEFTTAVHHSWAYLSIKFGF